MKKKRTLDPKQNPIYVTIDIFDFFILNVFFHIGLIFNNWLLTANFVISKVLLVLFC